MVQRQACIKLSPKKLQPEFSEQFFTGCREPNVLRTYEGTILRIFQVGIDGAIQQSAPSTMHAGYPIAPCFL